LSHPGHRSPVDRKTGNRDLAAETSRQINSTISRFEHFRGGKPSPLAGEPLLLAMIRKSRDHHVVPALKELSSKFPKLCRAIREPVQENKNMLGGPAVLKELISALRPDAIRGSARQRSDLANRFVVWNLLDIRKIHNSRRFTGENSTGTSAPAPSTDPMTNPLSENDLLARPRIDARKVQAGHPVHTPRARGSQMNL
jgi:hypothetical protein